MDDRPRCIEGELAMNGAFCDGGSRECGFEEVEGRLVGRRFVVEGDWIGPFQVRLITGSVIKGKGL